MAGSGLLRVEMINSLNVCKMFSFIHYLYAKLFQVGLYANGQRVQTAAGTENTGVKKEEKKERA
jgi:hypothetical protein